MTLKLPAELIVTTGAQQTRESPLMRRASARHRDRFILSINDTPGAREAFGRFAIEEVETTYTISTASSGGGKRVGELIVRG